MPKAFGDTVSLFLVILGGISILLGDNARAASCFALAVYCRMPFEDRAP